MLTNLAQLREWLRRGNLEAGVLSGVDPVSVTAAMRSFKDGQRSSKLKGLPLSVRIHSSTSLGPLPSSGVWLARVLLAIRTTGGYVKRGIKAALPQMG